MDTVTPITDDLAVLLALTDTGGYLETVSVGLYQADITPSKATVIGDLTPADFSGYAAVAANPWLLPYIDQAGKAKVAGEAAQFLQTAATITNIVYGWYMWIEGTPDVLVAAARFDSPIAFTGIGISAIVVPEYPR